ncbi:MAG: DUF1501 domain-containing protein [Flammeovirgaceae bacterium]|nr:DUF1501 domain-containing protein [Flammeovirgaceae bacterium]
MKRRKFLRNLSVASSAPLFLNGIPINVFANQHKYAQFAANENSDKVMIILQLHGGNDGLNMVIPVEQYTGYYNLRPNIAIPDRGSRKYIELDNTLTEGEKVGLHPDMLGVKELYDSGKVNIVQGVSYEKANGSHFRGRDVFFMGGGYEDYYSSGWMGRFLNDQFQAYPDGDTNNLPYNGQNEMKDPPGLEIGSGVSLAFHRNEGIPISLSVRSPLQFHDLINSVGGELPMEFPDSHYGDELEYIMKMDQQSNVFGARLKEVYENGSNSPDVTYPEKYPLATQRAFNNPLSSQLRLIARLLKGGIKTRFFLARIGGFDTHADQVESYEPTFGHHAALMYHISSAMKAFQDDLKGLGIEDRVMTVTMSEFGRRAKSNGSFGTDHGNAAPTMIFGAGVNPGIIGANPDLANLKGGNVPMQYDYRQVLTSVVQNWMGADEEAVKRAFELDTPEKTSAFLDNQLPVVNPNGVTGINDSFFSDRFRLNGVYPNPVQTETTFSYYINNSGNVKLRIFNMEGKVVKEVINEYKPFGEHEVTVNLKGLKAGLYIYRLEAGKFSSAKKLTIVP